MTREKIKESKPKAALLLRKYGYWNLVYNYFSCILTLADHIYTRSKHIQ